MLAHEPDTFETNPSSLTVSENRASSTSETVDVNFAGGVAEENFEDLLEDAVDQAIVPLIGTIPRAERLVRRAALRAELDTLVVAHRELEVVPERAMEEAVAHFARLHPAPLQRPATQTQNTIANITSSQNALSQIRLLTLTKTEMSSVYSAMCLALCVLTPFYLLDVSGTAGRLWHGEAWNLYRLEALAVPLLGGLIVGLLNRRQAVRGTLMANALLAIPAFAFPALLFTLSILTPPVISTGTTTVTAAGQSFWDFLGWFTNLAPGIVGLTCWPLLSSLGAAAGQRLSSFFRPLARH